MADKRCLMIVPTTFYTFHETLADGLRARGYHVDILNEEFPANTLGKILGKLALPILRRTTLTGLRRRLDETPPYDLALLLHGRGLGPEALAYLRTRARRIVGYNWDSLRYNPSPRDWLAACDRFATFDIADAAKTGLPLVHLFSASPVVQPNTVKTHDLSVVMKIHSDRLIYVDRVLAALKGRAVYVFLYAPNIFEMIRQAVRAPGPMWRLRRYIRRKPLSYAEAMGAIAGSRATLDYAHPAQSGITVRCFEALSMGVPVITNNPHAAGADVFPEGACAVFGLGDPPGRLAEVLDRQARRDMDPVIRDMRAFLDDLLGDRAGDMKVATEPEGPRT